MKTSAFLPLATIALTLTFCEKCPCPPGDSPGPGEDEPVPVRLDTTVLVTGVEFPEDYDWRRDTARGDVSCKIVLFKNGKRILEVPSGPSTHTCADPDMHRIVGGRLYTEFSSQDKTFLTRDGASLFSFSGRELICGMIVEGSDVWTLGQDRDGRGFTLRKNGKDIIRSESGIIPGRMGNPLLPTGALYEDKGRKCFAWKTVETVGVAKKTDWHLYCDGEVTDLPYDSTISEVFDVRMAGGAVCKAYRLRSSPISFMVAVGDEKHIIIKPAGFSPLNMRLVPEEDGLLAVGEGDDSSGTHGSCIWDLEGVRKKENGEMVTFSISEKGTASVSCDREGYVETVRGITRNWSLEKYIKMMTPSCLCTAGESAFVALTPGSGNPFIFREGEKTEVVINGYLTSISVSINEI